MANTIKAGTILIRKGALLPESLLIESEPASRCQGNETPIGTIASL